MSKHTFEIRQKLETNIGDSGGLWFAMRRLPGFDPEDDDYSIRYLTRYGEAPIAHNIGDGLRCRAELVAHETSAYFETREECEANVAKHGHEVVQAAIEKATGGEA